MSEEPEAIEPLDMPVVYAVRFSREAEQNAIEIADALEDDEQAVALYARFYREPGKSLSLFPTGRAVHAEDSALLGFEVRRLLVGNYHLLYRIEQGDDGPLVGIVCIRHAAGDALNESDAERILRNQ